MTGTLPFARFGVRPLFDEPLHVAQLNLPPWPKVEAALSDILTRARFANHGPLVQRLETRLQDFLQVRHVVCVANGTLALMALARALEISGEVIVPTFTFPATVQALAWAGLTPVFADVRRDTHMLGVADAERLITPRTAAILGVHLWGGGCQPEEFEALSRQRGLRLFFDACHGFGCVVGGRRIGNFGDGEAFSFHATKILNAMEGGAIATNDPVLAARLRTIRSFHATETLANVSARMNAKMSEAQAAMALLSLDDYPRNRAVNRELYLRYEAALSTIPGLTLVTTPSNVESNHQYIVIEVDARRFGLDRDTLYDLLEAENIYCRKHFCPPVHDMPGFREAVQTQGASFPEAEALAQRVLQLPTGGNLPPGAVERICEHLVLIHAHAPEIVNLTRTTKCG